MSQMPPPLPPSNDPWGRQFPDVLPPTIPGPLGGNPRAHRGGAVLAMGIVALAVLVMDFLGLAFPPCCLGVTAISIGLAIPAWVMANVDLAAMDAGLMDQSGREQTRGGRLCAIIAIALNALSLLGCVGFALVFGLGQRGGWFGP